MDDSHLLFIFVLDAELLVGAAVYQRLKVAWSIIVIIDADGEDIIADH